jgi:transcriptional regulator with XRE-family HTH domain
MGLKGDWNMLELYTNIKKRRQELNMSQQELAEAVGYKGKSMVSQVENGLVDLPESMIIKFADALYTTPATLMGWENVNIDPVSGYPIHNDANQEQVNATGDPEAMKQAMLLYELYQKAPQEIQAAIETLLKSQSHDS